MVGQRAAGYLRRAMLLARSRSLGAAGVGSRPHTATGESPGATTRRHCVPSLSCNVFKSSFEVGHEKNRKPVGLYLSSSFTVGINERRRQVTAVGMGQ